MSGKNEQSEETELAEMTEEAARRIQSHADRTGENQDFKRRAQSAAAKNASQDGDSSSGDSGSSSESGE